MSIESISSATAAQAPDRVQGPGSQFRTAFRAVADAIESGDLAGAQKAFASLQQIADTRQPTGGKGDDTLKKDFENVGKALQSGDLKTAKKDLLTLREDARSTRGAGNAHRHHRHAKTQGATPTTPALPTTNETTTPDVPLGDLGQGVDTIA